MVTLKNEPVLCTAASTKKVLIWPKSYPIFCLSICSTSAISIATSQHLSPKKVPHASLSGNQESTIATPMSYPSVDPKRSVDTSISGTIRPSELSSAKVSVDIFTIGSSSSKSTKKWINTVRNSTTTKNC